MSRTFWKILKRPQLQPFAHLSNSALEHLARQILRVLVALHLVVTTYLVTFGFYLSQEVRCVLSLRWGQEKAAGFMFLDTALIVLYPLDQRIGTLERNVFSRYYPQLPSQSILSALSISKVWVPFGMEIAVNVSIWR